MRLGRGDGATRPREGTPGRSATTPPPRGPVQAAARPPRTAPGPPAESSSVQLLPRARSISCTPRKGSPLVSKAVLGCGEAGDRSYGQLPAQPSSKRTRRTHGKVTAQRQGHATVRKRRGDGSSFWNFLATRRPDAGLVSPHTSLSGLMPPRPAVAHVSSPPWIWWRGVLVAHSQAELFHATYENFWAGRDNGDHALRRQRASLSPFGEETAPP